MLNTDLFRTPFTSVVEYALLPWAQPVLGHSEPHRCPAGYANLKPVIEPCTHTTNQREGSWQSGFWAYGFCLMRVNRGVVGRGPRGFGQAFSNGGQYCKTCQATITDASAESAEEPKLIQESRNRQQVEHRGAKPRTHNSPYSGRFAGRALFTFS
jgi:hypothetical protein